MASDKAKGDEIEEKPIVIDKWDSAACKNALDDAAKKVLVDEFGYVEDYSLMDGRLLISTIAVLFALFALVWDYFRPFPESKPVLIMSVLSYFFLMGVLTLYVMFKEKGIFLVALQKDKAGVDPDCSWTVSSNVKRFGHEYELKLHFLDGISGQSREKCEMLDVTHFFDENGTLVYEVFAPIIKRLHSDLGQEKKKK